RFLYARRRLHHRANAGLNGTAETRLSDERPKPHGCPTGRRVQRPGASAVSGPSKGSRAIRAEAESEGTQRHLVPRATLGGSGLLKKRGAAIERRERAIEKGRQAIEKVGQAIEKGGVL